MDITELTKEEKKRQEGEVDTITMSIDSPEYQDFRNFMTKVNEFVSNAITSFVNDNHTTDELNNRMAVIRELLSLAGVYRDVLTSSYVLDKVKFNISGKR